MLTCDFAITTAIQLLVHMIRHGGTMLIEYADLKIHSM